jgi:hypothetical protein
MRLIKTGTNLSSEHPHSVLIEPRFIFMLSKRAEDAGVTPSEIFHRMIEQVLASAAQKVRFQDYINHNWYDCSYAATAEVLYTSECTSALLHYLSCTSGQDGKKDQTAQLLIHSMRPPIAPSTRLCIRLQRMAALKAQGL